MNDSHGALILISFPHQLVHALAALEEDRKRRNIALDSPVTLFVWSYRWRDHRANVFYIRMIKELARLSHCQIYHPSLLKRIFRFSEYRFIKKRAESLAKTFSAKNYDSFYFSHDASADHTAQAFMQFLPHAHKICFGDPPGFLFKSHSSIQEYMEERGGSFIKRCFWNSRLRKIEQWFGYDSAYVAVNMNHASHHHATAPALLSRHHFIQLVHSIKESMSHLERQEKAFIESLGTKISGANLLVLSNLTESKLISRENELQLYLEICHRYCRARTTIIIKPHIASNYSFIVSLKKHLTGYDVIILPEYLRAVPLEMLTRLLQKCNIISVSSSSVFLSYLYGKENITHALSTPYIQQFFNESSRQYMIDATNAMTTVISELD